MILDGVMAEAARIPAAAVGALDLDVALVVLATQDGFLVRIILLIVFHPFGLRAVGGSHVVGIHVVILIRFQSCGRKRRRFGGAGAHLVETLRVGGY